MTFELQKLIESVSHEVTRNACLDGEHDWFMEGGRCCPTGAEGCGQTVYVCRACGVYDYGDHDESPSKIECKAVCGDSMMGWRNGPLDPDPEWLDA